MFSCEYCVIFNNVYFEKYLRTDASAFSCNLYDSYTAWRRHLRFTFQWDFVKNIQEQLGWVASFYIYIYIYIIYILYIYILYICILYIYSSSYLKILRYMPKNWLKLLSISVKGLFESQIYFSLPNFCCLPLKDCVSACISTI